MGTEDAVVRAAYEEEGEIGLMSSHGSLGSQFSFVYFNFGIIFACCIFWGLFLASVMIEEKKRTINLYHDTISSFCASSDSWENRFLLTFTVLISMNLLCMFTEEYNSRKMEAQYLWLFIMECSAASSFPLVGICYTEGKHIHRDAFERQLSAKSYQKSLLSDLTSGGSLDLQTTEADYELLNDGKVVPLKAMKEMGTNYDYGADTEMYVQRENTALDCGRCKIPIFYSMLVHSFAALYFLFLLSFCNIYYVWNLWLYHEHKPATYVCLALAILNMIVLPTFITVQGIIALRWKRLCGMKRARMISFAFEAASGFIVILLAVVGSMKRNENIRWFD